MPFIVQGKTNWRFILIVFALVLIVAGGILVYQNQWLSDRRANITNDCADHGERVRGDGQGFPEICCSDLKPMYGSEKEDCGLPDAPGDIGVCSDCGNGICESQNNENKCNCPQDCSETKTTTEEPIIKDCGTLGADTINDTEGVKECFELAFKDCQPAKMVTSVAGLATYYYEIIGLNNNSCIVKSKFLTNINLEWVGKEMICRYDNSKSFDIVIQDFIGKCSGPLYDLMTKGTQLNINPSCNLKTNITKVELLKGVSSSITAIGFRGFESQVAWAIKDKNIATVSPLSGKTVMLKPINVGSTQLVITDNAVGADCFVSVPVTIFE